jgi:uncharacterized membrane protein YjgN (DUF898 family)
MGCGATAAVDRCFRDTLGLAYPWMKMRFIRYQATHSHVEGNLDDVALTDHDEQVEKGFSL